MRNFWCLEKKSILPLIISATGIVPQSLFKNLKILDLISTALLLDSIIRNSVCTPAKLPCRRVVEGYVPTNNITMEVGITVTLKFKNCNTH
jgi:hypothetical protein